MAIAVASSLSLRPSHCQQCYTEVLCCSTSYGIRNSWTKSPFEGQRVSELAGVRCKNSFLGSMQFHWLSVGHDLCPSKVSVAADYSDSVPDSSNYTSNQGYHPLEELKVCKRIRDTKLTSAEIARTAVEANSSALLVFPGMVHCEPHEQISWAEFHYLVDDYGDIFFQIFDDENIIEDRGGSTPVNALIGMDIPIYENRRISGEHSILDTGSANDIAFDDDYFEVVESEESDIPVDWGMTDTASAVHPIYFAKCLSKVINTEYIKRMDRPSNGVSIVGCLRPAFADEESYLQTLHCEDSDGYNSDWKDGEILSFTKSDGTNTSSTLYRLEILKIELFSVYGIQSAISLQDFQDAEPDGLVHSTSEIVERFGEKGIRFNVALKALCKKKGLHVEGYEDILVKMSKIIAPLAACVLEGAKLIGVDSLGMDVRVLSGVEVKTHRFPFKVRATTDVAAEKQIQQLLFPRSRRKKLAHCDRHKEPYSF